MGAPTQIDVLTEERDVLGESAHRVEEVRPDEHAGVGDGEDLTGDVVLRLVELARLGQRGREAVRVDGVADRPQFVVTVPVDELRTDDARIGTERLGDQRGQCTVAQSDIVVEDQVEGRALDRDEYLVGRGGETTVGVESLDEGGGQDICDALGRILSARVVDHEHREILVVLIRERLEGFLEPVTRIRGDDHCDHGRSAETDQRLRVREAPLRVQLVVVDLDRVVRGRGHRSDVRLPVEGTHGTRSRLPGSGIVEWIGLVIDRGNGRFLRPGNDDGTAGIRADRSTHDGPRS